VKTEHPGHAGRHSLAGCWPHYWPRADSRAGTTSGVGRRDPQPARAPPPPAQRPPRTIPSRVFLSSRGPMTGPEHAWAYYPQPAGQERRAFRVAAATGRAASNRISAARFTTSATFGPLHAQSLTVADF